MLPKKSKSIVEPAYVGRNTDQWITFPWSADKPSVSIDEALG